MVHNNIAKAVLALVAAFALLQSERAHAQPNRVTLNLHGWSASGDSALVEERVEGPAGGGTLALWVISSDDRTATRFLFSSDFSAGSGWHGPQQVSREQCLKQVEQAGALPKRKGLSDLVDFEGACADANDAEHGGKLRYLNLKNFYADREATKLDLTMYDKPRRRGDWMATMTKDGVSLEHGDIDRAFIPLQTDGTSFSVRISRNKKVILVFGEHRADHVETLSVWAGPSLAALKPIPLAAK